MITKVFKDAYNLIARNQYVHVDGESHTTVDKGASLFVNSDGANPVDNMDINHDFNVQLGSEANFNIQVDGASAANTKGNLTITVNKFGGISIQVHEGNVTLNQATGDLVILQGSGNTRHTILDGNYELSVPNGAITMQARDAISLQSNTAISLLQTDATNPTAKIQNRILVAENIQITTPNTLNVIVGERMTCVRTNADSPMDSLIVLSNRILLVGSFGVTAQSSSDSKNIV